MTKLEKLLKELEEVTTTGNIARYPTPFKVKKSKKGLAAGPPTAFTWKPKKRAWDLDSDIAWSPLGHPSEAKGKGRKPRKTETGHLGYMTRRGRKQGFERAV